MIQIRVTLDDAGNLDVRSTAPPYVVIGELSKAIALLTVQLGHAAATAPRVIPVNGDALRQRPNLG